MFDITPLVYCLSIFWGYRLLKQCRIDGNWWFHRLLAPVFGLILLLGPWILGLGNPLGRGLLSFVVLAGVADIIANSSSGKSPFQLMSFDEKLLFAAMIVGTIGSSVFQLI